MRVTALADWEIEAIGEAFADHPYMVDDQGMTIYNADQLTDMLSNAGFAKVTVHRNEKKHWLCLTAIKEV